MNELFRLQIGLVKVVENDSNKVDSILDSIHDDYVPKSFNIGNWETITEKVEEEQGFVFTDEQRAAIKLSLDNHVMTLTGGAGSGKTSSLNKECVVNFLSDDEDLCNKFKEDIKLWIVEE